MNYGLKTTMNADEASARGGALQCAMLSSRVKVKPFNIVDRIQYGINASFEGTRSLIHSRSISCSISCSITGFALFPTPSLSYLHHQPLLSSLPSADGVNNSVSIYQRGDEIPHKPRRLTFKNKTSDFTVTLSYDDAAVAMLPAGESRFLSRSTIKIPASLVSAAQGNLGDVRVTWNLDKHGFVYVQSAQLMEELPYTAEELAAAAAGKKLCSDVICELQARLRTVTLLYARHLPHLRAWAPSHNAFLFVRACQ
jgi:molecular chaperone DnaK (HSP70)